MIPAPAQGIILSYFGGHVHLCCFLNGTITQIISNCQRSKLNQLKGTGHHYSVVTLTETVSALFLDPVSLLCERYWEFLWNLFDLLLFLFLVCLALLLSMLLAGVFLLSYLKLSPGTPKLNPLPGKQ